MTLHQPRRPMSALVALLAASALLAGCSAGADSSVATPAPSISTDTPDSGASPTATEAGGFPTCDEVKAALGPEVAGLVELDGSENGVTTGSDGPSLGCAWHTEETASSSTDLEEYGSVSIGISHDPTYTEESMKPLGWTVDDARVAAAGAWALKVGGDYAPAAQLDATGVQVVRDGTVVVLTSGGVALQDVPGLAALTNEWALGAGVSVLKLMK